MPRLLQTFFLFLSTATDKELAHADAYLKEENRILRGKLPRQIVVTPQERTRL
jgi:hypothetical protein